MGRWVALAAVVLGAALVAASVPPREPPTIPLIPGDEGIPVVGEKTGYFNMARVLREYRRARIAVTRLDDRKQRMSANIAGLRGMLNDLLLRPAVGFTPVPPPPGGPAVVIAGGPPVPPGVVPAGGSTPAPGRALPADASAEAIMVSRLIEDADRELNKTLQSRATVVIVEIYDEMYAAVVEMAKEHGLVAVLAYPDAPTEQERNDPMIKELKLKPPAAMPFYLDPCADYTDELIRRLNAKPAPEKRAN